MWPVAPKMSQTFCFGGFEGEGGSVVYGRDSFARSECVALGERCVEGEEGPGSLDVVRLRSSILDICDICKIERGRCMSTGLANPFR